MRQLIKKLPVIGPCSRSVHAAYKRWQLDPARNLQRLLGGRPQLDFMQIGSNDGRSGDPVHRLIIQHPGWRGLFVEPVPYLFDRLKSNYSDHARFRFENVAIAQAASSLPFYYVSEQAKFQLEGLPVWYDQLGSFNREHILKHFDERIGPFITQIEVECISLATLIQRNQMENFELLHIDTEGYDWEVLRQLDLKGKIPAVILFEHKHLSIDDKNSALEFLRPNYRVTNLGADFLCDRLSPGAKSF